MNNLLGTIPKKLFTIGSLVVLTVVGVAVAQNTVNTQPTLVDLVVQTDSLSTLEQIVIDLDLVDTLNSEGPFTVFAPTNEAFADALAALGLTYEELAANPELLRTIVLYHVVPQNVSASAALSLADGTMVSTVEGSSITVASPGSQVMIDQATVISADIIASNGTAHVIDQVLIPAGVRTQLGLPAFDATQEAENNDAYDNDWNNSLTMPQELPHTGASLEG